MSERNPDRGPTWKVHGRIGGVLILAARRLRPGSWLNRTLYRANDYWQFSRWRARG